MDDTIDLLKIKIEKAKRELSLETVNAIDAVDWKAGILGLRNKYGYTFEQLGDLELETELLLCGLVNPENYPKELEKRMGISRSQADELVNEMNNLVFKKIREELIKNTERKKAFTVNDKKSREDVQILNSAGIEIVEKETLPIPEKLELAAAPFEKPIENREDIIKKIEEPEIIRKEVPEVGKVHPILAQKLSGSFQMGAVKTEHTLENITKTGNIANGTKISPKIDPYREIPE